ncbi:MAG: SAM-dependent methyltransferase [Pseudomonadota bacterium]|nr:MAG: SAM-dependent methyltransferase [Pseudomonadota bacterium]
MRTPVVDLPDPSPEQQARSAELAGALREEIDKHGPLPFARFMERALYTPGLGYYSGGHRQFGAQGDFITAPELGSVFARCLARQCAELLSAVRQGDLLEAGAGSGALARDLLLALERLDALPDRYFILELSGTLRARQHATLKARAPHLLDRVSWIDTPPADDFHGIILANELLDALPAERFRVTPNGVAALAVGWNGTGFTWCELPAPDAVNERVGTLALPHGYTSEVGLQGEAWVRTLGGAVAHGAMLLIDYGFPRAEFYHEQRTQGTLMCHYRQRAHTDPLILIGLQDITVHVDFTAVADAASAIGLDVLGYTSQAAFLTANGLEEIVAESDARNTRAHLDLTTEIKRLTLPSEMGELFKVIALGRGIDKALRGFSLQDRRHRL